MRTPTANAIIQALERRKFQSDMSRLAALDSAHSDAVRRALAAVPGNSKIDVRLLIESARREVAKQTADEPEGEPWRYAITLMSADQIAVFKELVESGTEPNEAANIAGWNPAWGPYPAKTRDKQDVQPDDGLRDDLNDDSSAPRKRRSVPRRRLLRASRSPATSTSKEP